MQETAHLEPRLSVGLGFFGAGLGLFGGFALFLHVSSSKCQFCPF